MKSYVSRLERENEELRGLLKRAMILMPLPTFYEADLHVEILTALSRHSARKEVG